MVLHKAVPRTVKVEGPDGRPVTGARISPRVIWLRTTAAEIPGGARRAENGYDRT